MQANVSVGPHSSGCVCTIMEVHVSELHMHMWRTCRQTMWCRGCLKAFDEAHQSSPAAVTLGCRREPHTEGPEWQAGCSEECCSPAKQTGQAARAARLKIKEFKLQKCASVPPPNLPACKQNNLMLSYSLTYSLSYSLNLLQDEKCAMLS